MRPALRWEQFVERMFALARNGHADRQETRAPTAMIDLLREFPREIATVAPAPEPANWD